MAGANLSTTMAIDLLGRTNNEIEAILQIMKEVAQFDLQPDGIVFDPASFTGEAIREDTDYAGVRTVFVARLDATRIHMHIRSKQGSTNWFNDKIGIEPNPRACHVVGSVSLE